MPAQLDINGFGRFGILVFRAASANPDVKVNAVNDPFMPLDYIVNQLQYDSVHERFNGTTAMSEEDREGFFIVSGAATGSSTKRTQLPSKFRLRLRVCWHLQLNRYGTYLQNIMKHDDHICKEVEIAFGPGGNDQTWKGVAGGPYHLSQFVRTRASQ